MGSYEGIWRKRQLLPLWILQVLAAGIYVLVAALLLAAARYVKSHPSSFGSSYYGYSESQLISYANITGGVILALASLTIIFDIIEAVLYAKRNLNPVVLLVFACFKTGVWGFFFITILVSLARGTGGIVDFLLTLFLFATSLVQLVLGAKYTHQKRKGTLGRGTYKPTTSVEAGHHPTYEQELQQPLAYDSAYRSTSPVPSYGGHPTAMANSDYHSQGLEMQPPPKTGHY